MFIVVFRPDYYCQLISQVVSHTHSSILYFAFQESGSQIMLWSCCLIYKNTKSVKEYYYNYKGEYTFTCSVDTCLTLYNIINLVEYTDTETL